MQSQDSAGAGLFRIPPCLSFSRKQGRCVRTGKPIFAFCAEIVLELHHEAGDEAGIEPFDISDPRELLFEALLQDFSRGFDEIILKGRIEGPEKGGKALPESRCEGPPAGRTESGRLCNEVAELSPFERPERGLPFKGIYCERREDDRLEVERRPQVRASRCFPSQPMHPGSRRFLYLSIFRSLLRAIGEENSFSEEAFSSALRRNRSASGSSRPTGDP